MNRRAAQTGHEWEVLPMATAMRARLNHSRWRRQAPCREAVDMGARLRGTTDEQGKLRDR